MGDLVARNGLWYKQFSDVPFTGKVTGREQGSFKNGKADGTWVEYYNNGQVLYKYNYKNGKLEGAFVTYWKNGQLRSKGNHENGKQEGAFVMYRDNGRLWSKGTWKNDKREGTWADYNKDGTVDKEYAGTFKDGKKISD